MSRILSALLLFWLALPSWAAEPSGPLLRVGISEVPPFVIQEENGEWRGISIDLWQEIAAQAGYRFELQPMAFQELLPSLEADRLDVVVGALTMTAEREARFDFTHPFYQTGLAIAVPREGEGGGWHALRALLSWQFLSLVLGLAALLLLVGALVWLFERRRNQEQFGGSPAQGLGSSFWWAAVTMTTVGYGDKAPVTLGGRLIGLVWMFAGLIMVSTFTAAVTSTLTVGNLQGGIQGTDDLRRAHVATIDKTVSARYLENQRIRHSDYPNLLSAMRAVQQGEADAVVYDLPILQYRNGELGQGGLRVLPGTFENQSYAFALASGSPYREQLSQAILRVTGSDDWRKLKELYLGRP
ncbi:transporter substrate-binding domain-containing protein [Pseudomonas sp. LPB0260]|uniref:transporter substrate-binding domain-containing protein n=1 Tax=Pseudomonas sp. LPB0260 TaxID=2614442 RepID=UPI0015C2806D|nr:transporter substrate-binding domain-containing protein [Pseudomonas sp. LPB0260]QLC72857.1 transporter substrate-binding domain-containing protein [Pseudomonas sp. LPB0260]QLC75631.1 transporter substrate-binding domain-containing protein [Pseudomonas sp. LPB0260]